jgi:hypothetical protein
MRKAPKVNASLIRKYHIISFPYSTLKGLLPPFHQFALVATAVAISKFIVWGLGWGLADPSCPYLFNWF